jgi:hypothetical protein
MARYTFLPITLPRYNIPTIGVGILDIFHCKNMNLKSFNKIIKKVSLFSLIVMGLFAVSFKNSEKNNSDGSPSLDIFGLDKAHADYTLIPNNSSSGVDTPGESGGGPGPCPAVYLHEEWEEE